MPASALKRPLVFGDKEQIQAIRELEARNEYEKLPACEDCAGRPECYACHRECEFCDGTGKDQKALAEWREKYPCGKCQ